MHMRVEYHLPRAGPVVHTEINAVGLKRLFKCVGDDTGRTHSGGPIFLVDVEDVRRMLFGYHERMAGIYRADIKESERLFILIHYLRGEFPRDYFTEQAIGVIHVSSIPREIWDFTHYTEPNFLSHGVYNRTSCMTS